MQITVHYDCFANGSVIRLHANEAETFEANACGAIAFISIVF